MNTKKSLIQILSENLKQKRAELNISQEKLAELLDVHRNTIAFIERKQRNISLELLEKLAQVLNCSASSLIEDKSNKHH
jgi:transcriptional regulator with XRE-family HTH domain